MEETLLHPATSQHLRPLLEEASAGTYIFVGPESVGKFTAARKVGQTISNNSSLFESGEHPDFMIVKPDGQSIGIDQVNELERKLSLRAEGSQKRIVIIDTAHKLTMEAQNALLKTLEEPPAQTTIILICEQAHDLLGTIRSRGQIIRFRPLASKQISQHLIDQTGVDSEKARQIAAISNGRLGKALEIADDEDLITEQIQRRQFVKKLLSSPPYQRLIYAYKIYDSNQFEPESFGRLLCAVIHQQLREESGESQVGQLVDAFRASAKFIRRIEANTNQKLAVFDLMLELPQCSLA